MKQQTQLSADQKAVRQVVMDIIEYGSVYNVEKLDRLYSDSMQVIRVARDGSTVVLGKNEVLQFFMDKRAANTKPARAHADFHHIEVNGEEAKVLVTREMKLFGSPEKSVYSISLAKTNRNWKVVKETVVARA